MLSSDVVGLDIYNSRNDDIGKVQEIAFDVSEKVTGYILSVAGFLGMGTRHVAVNPDARC
jgi:sporulation protein YlmC with PRC-barrel domain